MSSRLRSRTAAVSYRCAAPLFHARRSPLFRAASAPLPPHNRSPLAPPHAPRCSESGDDDDDDDNGDEGGARDDGDDGEHEATNEEGDGEDVGFIEDATRLGPEKRRVDGDAYHLWHGIRGHLYRDSG